MRYAVIAKGLTISQLEDEVKRCGGSNLRIASASRQIFCDLDEAGVVKLRDAGCAVSKIGGVKATVMPPIVTPPVPVAAAPVYSPEQLVWAAGYEDMRQIVQPPLYGEGCNLAIVDTGIRETHEKIDGHVIYRKNYTSDPMRDGLDHGTGVCDVALAVAPLCNILNMKVLDDKGEGTEEEVAMAIDDCISLHDTDPGIAPTVINLSLGAPDDGNPDNPLRVACRAAIDRGIWVFASAGNSGPVPYSVTSPACERYVFAVGSIKYEPFTVSEFSSRGPTIEGLIKPDAVTFGEDLVMASSESDAATIAKSGTSFATPFGSALAVIYHEALYRQAELLEPVVRYPAGVILQVSEEELIDTYLPMICIKPEGEAAGKDYAYGYGLPYGPFAFQALMLRPAIIDISTMLSAVAPLMVLGMLGIMMSSMAKGGE